MSISLVFGIIEVEIGKPRLAVTPPPMSISLTIGIVEVEIEKPWLAVILSFLTILLMLTLLTSKPLAKIT